MTGKRQLDVTQRLIVHLDTALKKSPHDFNCDKEPCCSCWKRPAQKALREAINFERQRRKKKRPTAPCKPGKCVCGGCVM